MPFLSLYPYIYLSESQRRRWLFICWYIYINNRLHIPHLFFKIHTDTYTGIIHFKSKVFAEDRRCIHTILFQRLFSIIAQCHCSVLRVETDGFLEPCFMSLRKTVRQNKLENASSFLIFSPLFSLYPFTLASLYFDEGIFAFIYVFFFSNHWHLFVSNTLRAGFMHNITNEGLTTFWLTHSFHPRCAWDGTLIKDVLIT